MVRNIAGAGRERFLRGPGRRPEGFVRAGKATALAHPNIALVKYWGKRDEKLILPHQALHAASLTFQSRTFRAPPEPWFTAFVPASIVLP